jgi:hypothetical protein
MQRTVGGIESSGGHEYAQHDARFHGDAHWHTPEGQPENAELPHECDDSGAQDGNHKGLKYLHRETGVKRTEQGAMVEQGVSNTAAAFSCALSHDA